MAGITKIHGPVRPSISIGKWASGIGIQHKELQIKDYPNFLESNDVPELLRYIVKERKNDVKDFDNLTNTFISGRKSGKVPTGAADISDTDRVGDFSYDVNYIYIVVNNAGTAEWRRAALSSW